MNATHAQIDFLRELGKEVHGDEYWINEHFGLSHSVNLTKKITKQQASEAIDGLLTAKEQA